MGSLNKRAYCLKERLLGRSTFSILDDLLESQHWDKKKMQERQNANFSEALDVAFKKSPFYKELYEKNGVKREDIKDLSDIKKLPVLTKEMFRDNHERMLVPGFSEEQLCLTRSSGSTGMRLVFRRDNKMSDYALAHQLRGKSWWDIHPGDREIKFWGTAWTFEETLKGKFTAYLKYLKDRSVGVIHLSAFKVKEGDLKKVYKLLKSYRPEFLFGYGNALYMFADYIHRNHGSLGDYSPKAVIYTAEYQSKEKRSLMARSYGAPIVSEFGSVECGIHTYECREGKHHFSDESLFFEVLDNNGENVENGEGCLYLTHLLEKATPIIRYKIGDIVTIKNNGQDKCSCGLNLTVFEDI
ncbi:MAG: phenylacetate--CoA ligase family protein, partial [Nitrospinae bacterium]|nr:phenylacetate--CoA ligase family protein [Nitrospinota bacterium]